MRSSRVSLLARFGSAAAVAGLALAGVMAPVSAASAAKAHRHHHHRLATHLFVRSRAMPKTHHKSDVIVGLLRSRGHALAGRSVSLMSKTAHHKFALVSSAKTGKHGFVRWTVTPTARTFYVLTFKGGPKFRGTHSAVIVLRAPKA